jgi:hypothetical protein
MLNTISILTYITLSQMLFYLWQTAYLIIETALALIVIFAVVGMSILERLR